MGAGRSAGHIVGNICCGCYLVPHIFRLCSSSHNLLGLLGFDYQYSRRLNGHFFSHIQSWEIGHLDTSLDQGTHTERATGRYFTAVCLFLHTRINSHFLSSMSNRPSTPLKILPACSTLLFVSFTTSLT